MTLVRVNPRRKARRNHSIFDSLFNELSHTNFNTTRKNRPAVNVLEMADNFRIDLLAPGLQKEDFDINIDKDILTIEANKETELKEGEKLIQSEFNFGKFKRTFRLPETIDTGNISANFENGILSITLLKKEEAKELPPRTIAIQ